MLVSVVGEKKPGECGDGILGAPDSGAEQDHAGFCQRSVSVFNNLCIMYDDMYAVTPASLFKFLCFWLCVENGMSGVSSLMAWVISALCALNKRYNQMEGAAAGMSGFFMLMYDNSMTPILE